MSLRSRLAEPGRQIVTPKPSAAPNIAYEIAVLPLEESRRRFLGSSPSRTAAETMPRAARSFTLPPGFALSSFRKTRVLPPSRASGTSGVFPTRRKSGCARSSPPSGFSSGRALKRTSENEKARRFAAGRGALREPGI
jgi:hypothetical protein